MAKIFQNKIFVINKNEPRELRQLIPHHGGKIVKQLSASVSYFVLSYNNTDDNRLKRVHKLGVIIVPSDYIFTCCRLQTVVPIEEHAVGMYSPPSENPSLFFCDTFDDKKLRCLLDVFNSPKEEWREIEEQPQCYADFLRMPTTLKPSKLGKQWIYLLPLNAAMKTTPPASKKRRHWSSQSLLPELPEILAEYVEAFFSFPVRLLPSEALSPVKGPKQMHLLQFHFLKQPHIVSCCRRRGHPSQPPSLEVVEVIESLNNHSLPDDCLALLVLVQNCHLHEGDMKVYGRATGDGVCCVAQLEGSVSQPKALYHLLAVASHEFSHCFGVDHCAYFGCVMNACCDHEAAAYSDNPPLQMCPIDLRKLHSVFQFDIVKRWMLLRQFYEKYDLTDAMSWMNQILSILT